MITMHLDDTVINSLTDNELNILKYIHGHPEEILKMSVHELAGQVSYSAATVLRFCKKLGFSGFAELKYALRQELKEGQPAIPANTYSLDTQLLIDNLSTNIEGTARLIQEEQLRQIFRYLDSGCPIYLWTPVGITSILADYLEKLLFSIGRQRVYKVDPCRTGEQILRHIRAGALLVMIGAPGELAAAVNLAKMAQIDDIPVLSITPYADNTISGLATVNLRFFTDLRESKGAGYTSRLPIFYVIHLIVHIYMHHKQTVAPSPDRTGRTGDPLVPDPLVSGQDPPVSPPVIPLFEKARQISLTDTEKGLLRYFEDNLPASTSISLKELGAKLYTSNATIVRFCQKLGLKGYNEFKYQLRSELEQLKRPVFSSNSLISRSVALFKADLADVDMALLESVAALLTQDRPVYIYGSAMDSLAADYLHKVLAALDYPSMLIQWPSLLDDLTCGIGSDAVLFLITTHGDDRRYLPIFQRARQKKAATILLTCRTDSPLLPCSTYGLYMDDHEERDHEERYPHTEIDSCSEIKSRLETKSHLKVLTIIQLLIELIVRKGRP